MKKQETENLWRLCFHDTDAFIRLYFDKVYQDEHALTIERKGKVVAALQLLPYTMQIDGVAFPFAYVSGVCTHPDYRGQGLMRELMAMADDRLRAEQIPLAALIPAEPWLFDVYRKSDYLEAFFYRPMSYKPKGVDAQRNAFVSIADTLPNEELYAYLHRKEMARPAGVLHSLAQIDVVRQDMAISGGNLLVARNPDWGIVGLAFALPEENGESYVAELIADDDQAKDALLSFVVERYQSERVLYPCDPIGPSRKAKGMAKIILPDYFEKNGITVQRLFTDREARMTLMLD